MLAGPCSHAGWAGSSVSRCRTPSRLAQSRSMLAWCSQKIGSSPAVLGRDMAPSVFGRLGLRHRRDRGTQSCGWVSIAPCTGAAVGEAGVHPAEAGASTAGHAR